MKKITIFLISWLIGISSAFAINANEVMKKTADKIESTPSLSAVFTVSNPQVGGYAGGNFAMQNKKFCIVGNGFGVWYDGTQMWSYSDQTNETTLSYPTQQELLEVNPMEIISKYSTNYKASLKSSTGGIYKVELTPTHKNSSIKKATVTINGQTWLPIGIDVVLANGNAMTILISNIVTTVKFSQETFMYPQREYPGIEVIDLR